MSFRKLQTYKVVLIRFLKIWKIRNLLHNAQDNYFRTFEFNSQATFLSNFTTAIQNNDQARVSSDTLEKIVWIVPPASEYGGGFRTISRFVRLFDRYGVNQQILIHHPYSDPNLELQRKIWSINFSIPNSVPIDKSNTKFLKNSIVIATGWQTLAFVIRHVKKSARVWFVQDLETLFHITGSLTAAIEESFMEFEYAITAGSWLKEECMKRGIHQVEAFHFGVDELYFQNSSLASLKNPNIVCYFQIEKEWRGSLFLLEILKSVLEKNPDWSATLVGDDYAERLNLPANISAAGRLSPVELSNLYAESSIGLCISFSNASLVPFEMMKSGLPVLTNIGENNEWLNRDNDENLIFAHATYENFSAELNKLIIKINHGWIPTPSVIPSWDDVMENFIVALKSTEAPIRPISFLLNKETTANNFQFKKK